MNLSKLVGYALVIGIVLGTAFQSLAQPSPKERVEQVAVYLPVDLGIKPTWINCTGVNGWYYPGSTVVVLCNQNLKNMGVARFVYLHELGHAYTFTREVDYARWLGNYEAAADEWAAVFSVVQGHPKDLLAMADEFERWARLSAKDEDPHPPAMERANKMRRMYYGYIYPWSVYGAEWRDSLDFWKRTLLRYGLS